MRFFYGVLIVLFSILMQSCVSLRHSTEIQEGKYYFKEGNFRDAFKKLLPAAADGDPRAQYAVGYMYYYGYGVNQDPQSGLFWIERSASQNYMPAIRALRVTDGSAKPPVPSCPAQNYLSPKSRIRSENFIQKEVTYKSTITADEVMRSIPHTEPKKIITPPSAPPAKKMIRAEGYGLQLFGAYQLDDVKKLQKKLSAENSTTIWHADNKGKDWYVLIYQQYPTAADARVAKKNLPVNLVEMKPWVRELSNLG